MADPGTILAIIQIVDRIVGLCKHYIETVCDAPADFRSILVEISMLKAIFETIHFLMSTDGNSSTLVGLGHGDGPVQHCYALMKSLENLLPSSEIYTVRAKMLPGEQDLLLPNFKCFCGALVT